VIDKRGTVDVLCFFFDALLSDTDTGDE
jgi:hypothetical protein